ncbi:MAG: kelch repeat-containing protein [Verrucomicrobiota bacterium]
MKISLLICMMFTPLLLAAKWKLIETDGTPVPRNESSLTEVDGLFYLIGGRGMPPVSIFNPVDNRWRNASTPPIEIHHLQPVVIEGKIYIICAMTGKFPNETGLEKVLVYDPKADEWTWGHEIPAERQRGAAGVVEVDGQVYIAGGIVRGHVGGYVNWMDRYDPATGEWTVLADAPHERDHFQAAYLDGKIYAAGGRRTSQETKQLFELTVPEVDVYDIESNSWSVLEEPLPTPRAGGMTLTVKKEIVVLGGESAQRKAHSEVEAWCTEHSCWEEYPPMRQGRHGTGAVLYEDYIYTCAGTGRRGGKPNLDTTERLSIADQD